MSDLREKLADAKARRESDDGCQCPLGSGFLPQRQHAETCARNEVARLRADMAREREETADAVERLSKAHLALGADLARERTAREAAERANVELRQGFERDIVEMSALVQKWAQHTQDAQARAEAAEAKVALWRKATGREDPEALDFELGRAGIDTHLKVLTDLKEAAEREREVTQRQLDEFQGALADKTVALMKESRARLAAEWAGDALETDRDEWKAKVEAAEAGAAGLREAGNALAGHAKEAEELYGVVGDAVVAEWQAALRDPTGQALLERLEKAEAEVKRLTADQTGHYGCNLDPCDKCRAEKAEKAGKQLEQAARDIAKANAELSEDAAKYRAAIEWSGRDSPTREVAWLKLERERDEARATIRRIENCCAPLSAVCDECFAAIEKEGKSNG